MINTEPHKHLPTSAQEPQPNTNTEPKHIVESLASCGLIYIVWLSLHVQHRSYIILHSSIYLFKARLKRQPIKSGYSSTLVWLNVFPFSALCELTLKLLRFWPVNILPLSPPAWPMCHDLYIPPLCVLFPDSRYWKKTIVLFSVESGRSYKTAQRTENTSWTEADLLGWKGKCFFYENSKVNSDTQSLFRYSCGNAIYLGREDLHSKTAKIL